jgi:hypothetical protein
MGTVIGKVPLAPFAYDWVGGNISGLAQLGDTLYGYAPQVTDVAAALDAQVRRVVDAAGWRGSAASAFSAAWERDSATARAVGLAADQVAGIVGWLAVTLSRIEAGLEQAAAEVAAHGVAVGADGEPAQVCYATPGGAGQASAQQWLAAYQSFYGASMQAAREARETAAGTLAATVRQIAGNVGTRPARLAGDGNTVADLLGDLLAAPSARVRETRQALTAIEGELTKVQESVAAGRSIDLIKDLQAPASELKSESAALRGAEATETGLGKLADARVGDAVDRATNALRGGGAHVKVHEPDSGDDGGLLGDITDVGRDIPVLDVLAASLGTVLGTYQDTQGPQPQSLDTALPEEAGANFGGLAAAAAIAEIAGGPAGIVAGVLLPDDIDNTLHEPWATDVRDNGWAKGLVIANGNISENNVKDLAGSVEDNEALTLKMDKAAFHAAAGAAATTEHAAEQAWDDLF